VTPKASQQWLIAMLFYQHLANNCISMADFYSTATLPAMQRTATRDVNIGFFPNPDIELKNPV